MNSDVDAEHIRNRIQPVKSCLYVCLCICVYIMRDDNDEWWSVGQLTNGLIDEFVCITWFLGAVKVTKSDLTNSVINACFLMLFKDLIRLLACYNDAIINLLGTHGIMSMNCTCTDLLLSEITVDIWQKRTESLKSGAEPNNSIWKRTHSYVQHVNYAAISRVQCQSDQCTYKLKWYQDLVDSVHGIVEYTGT